MASSLVYVLTLVLMVSGAIGKGRWRMKRKFVQIKDYNRFIEQQTEMKSTLDERIAALEASSSGQSDLIQELNDTQKTMQETVVFSASVTDKTDYQPGDIYVFTNTMVNVGGGYDASTGYFEAPIAGTYMFTVQFCNKPEKEAIFYLKVADEIIVSTVYEGLDAAGSCASYTGVGVMQAGEKAWVECSWESREFTNDDYRWNMFSGVRL